MKKTHIALYAVLVAVALLAICFDATAGTAMLAMAAAVTVDNLPESELLPTLARRFKEKTDEADERIGEFGQRMTNLEQAVAKGLKAASETDLPLMPIDIKSIVDNPAFQEIRAGNKGSAREFALGEISLKALINSGGDASSGNSTFPTFANRLEGRLSGPLTPLRLLNVLPTRTVTSNKIEYTQLTPVGDADVQDGEGEQKAEMEFDAALVTANIATIAVHSTHSAQVLDDAEGLQALIERVMSNKVSAKAESQLIQGSGTGSFINGLNTQATWITTGQDSVPERIGQALTTMETAGYSPDLILMHPNDWFDVSILKDADGNYLYGNPASPARPTLWNRPVITSPNVPEGTALVGDSSQVTVLDRMAPTVFISRDHEDYRTRNLVLILIEARLGLELYDTAGFRKIDLGASG